MKVGGNWAADEADIDNEVKNQLCVILMGGDHHHIDHFQVKVLVAPSQQVSPQIIRRKISASFSTPGVAADTQRLSFSIPQHTGKISTSSQNSIDFDQKNDINLRTDIISEEPQNFGELMLKSLGLDWNVDQEKMEGQETQVGGRFQNRKIKSDKNRKREIKRRKIVGDTTKVKDDTASSAASDDDNGDYQSQRGKLDDDSLAEDSERTNVKEGLFSQESGSKEVKVEVFPAESGRKNLKEQLFSSLLNLKESVAELQEGISVDKEVKEKMGGQGKMEDKEREMDYGLWQPFYNEDAEDEVN